MVHPSMTMVVTVVMVLSVVLSAAVGAGRPAAAESDNISRTSRTQ